MRRLAIVGAGSWGTALAIALCDRFHSVSMWTRDARQAADMMASGTNARYLPGFQLPPNVTVAADLGAIVTGADVVLSVVPSAHLRAVFEGVRPHLSAHAVVVSASKGIEEVRLCRMSQVLADVLSADASRPVAVLSGPTFAREIAAGGPAAVVVACEDVELADHIQRAFSTPTLRLYTSSDVIGVEIGAALKNVIAIGAGVCAGLGLGSNVIAALVTRGLAEITRLAVALGGSPRTLSGLAGLGDLVLTATGDLSRNRSLGVQLGRGRKLNEILAGMIMVAEGVSTCGAAHRLGVKHQISLPIVNKMHEILYQEKDPNQALRELMERPLTAE